jgi:Ser/Thr protein kinase RdoA (MazF antagonist)
LSDPLLVRAIENEFIPVLVYNNRTGGMDGALMERYREPAWNYQVIRFLDGEGRDVIPRKDRVWTTGGVAARMIEALRAVDRPVPNYLKDLARMP